MKAGLRARWPRWLHQFFMEKELADRIADTVT